MNALQPRQVRAGMALLGWPSKVAAYRIGIASSGSVRASLGGRRPSLLPRLAAAMEAEGVEFIPGGVRLQSSPDRPA